MKVRTYLNVKVEDEALGPPPGGGYYAGEKLWRLNPRFAYKGHFTIPPAWTDRKERLEIEISVTVIDAYEREHQLLPNGWVYNREGNYWYFEP